MTARLKITECKITNQADRQRHRYIPTSTTTQIVNAVNLPMNMLIKADCKPGENHVHF